MDWDLWLQRWLSVERWLRFERWLNWDVILGWDVYVVCLCRTFYAVDNYITCLNWHSNICVQKIIHRADVFWLLLGGGGWLAVCLLIRCWPWCAPWFVDWHWGCLSPIVAVLAFGATSAEESSYICVYLLNIITCTMYIWVYVCIICLCLSYQSQSFLFEQFILMIVWFVVLSNLHFIDCVQRFWATFKSLKRAFYKYGKIK